MMNTIKQFFIVLFLGLTLTFTGLAQPSAFPQGSKPPEKPRERDKGERDKPRPDDRQRGNDDKKDDKKDKRRPD